MSGECVNFMGMNIFVDYITRCDLCDKDVGRENLTMVILQDGPYCLRELDEVK